MNTLITVFLQGYGSAEGIVQLQYSVSVLYVAGSYLKCYQLHWTAIIKRNRKLVYLMCIKMLYSNQIINSTRSTF